MCENNYEMNTKAEDIIFSPKKTILLSILSSIASLNSGFTLGYSSQAEISLTYEKMLIGDYAFVYSCIITPGGMLGGIIGGILLNRYGRRGANLILCFPFGIGYYSHILAFFCKSNPVFSSILLLTGRFLCGICCGTYLMSVSIYITEISPTNLRGLCGCFPSLFINIGIMMSYSLGYALIFLDYNNGNASFKLSTLYYPLIGILLTFLQILVYLFLPESPMWLIKNSQNPTFENNEQSSSDILNKKNLKPLLVSILLMLAQQCSGINVILFNATKFFQKSADILSASFSTIIIGSVLVLASFPSCFILHRFGRKKLLIAGFSVMASALFVNGLYYKLNLNHSSVPVAMISIFLFSFVCSVGPLPWLVMSEIFNKSFKEKGSSISSMSCWLFSFIITMIYNPLESLIGIYGLFWLYSAFSLISIIFVYCYVPETRNKTLDEIENLF